MRHLRIYYLVFICFTLHAQTEKNVDHQSLLWTRYYNILTLNDKWTVHSEFDNRIFLNPVKENLYEFRIQGRFKMNPEIELGAGFAYFSTATQDPEIQPDFNLPEYRGQQDLIWKQEFKNFSLQQRFQVEERFFQNANKEELLPGTTFFWRFRYRIQGDYTFWKKEHQFLKAIIYDELMINGGKNIIKNTFDQNRIYAALHYGVNKNIAIELGYLKSFQQRASGVDYFDRDIIRFTFFHKIYL
ncbi:DUF2490 domain-containing protein [Flavobacterium nackdongense]|uniref:DUF2490 domain-containing protein n=1 Tax=Flavobacterium nackdongense TaxID=2547394 RepID=A0A4P6Y7K9_9FLAO|nr:DUF2490 domain-containing protein [Flavobacterium nackdongense]QBN18651.1 DUF2490 domain-containing protein [Flavobacterium nackdongense]